jgi:hypothetical protein
MPILAKVGDDEARTFILSWLNLPECGRNRTSQIEVLYLLLLSGKSELSENLIEFLSSHPASISE